MAKPWLFSLLIFIYTLPVVLAVSFFGFFLIIFYSLYRGFTGLLVKVWRPQFKGRMSTLEQVTSKNLYGTPTPNLVQCLVVQGDIHLKEIVEVLKLKILSQPNLKRLLEAPVNFGGYHYWEEEEDFRWEKHVKEINGGEFRCGSDLNAFIERVTIRRWVEGRSPWEILVINDFSSHKYSRRMGSDTNDNLSMLILRSHFCLREAHNALFMDKSLLTPEWVQEMSGNGGIPYFGSNPSLLAPSLAVHDLLKLCFSLNICKNWNVLDDWNVSNFHVTFTRLRTEDVEEIKLNLGVSFQAVLLGIVTSALRQCWQEAGYGYMMVDYEEGAAVSFGGNQHLPSFLNLPISTKNSVGCVRMCDENLSKGTTSTFPRTWFWHQKVTGLVTSWLHGPSYYHPRIVLDIIRGCGPCTLYPGCQVKDVFHVCNYPGDNVAGISLVATVYEKEVTISMSTSNMEFPRQALDKFDLFCQKEAGILKLQE